MDCAMLEVTESNLDQFVAQIVELFHPDKIVLFGSRAYGVPKPFSDFDLFLIMDYEGKPLQKSLEILSAIGNPWNLDLHVKTASDVQKRFEQYSPLTRIALTKGKVLYERDSSRMAS